MYYTNYTHFVMQGRGGINFFLYISMYYTLYTNSYTHFVRPIILFMQFIKILIVTKYTVAIKQ